MGLTQRWIIVVIAVTVASITSLIVNAFGFEPFLSVLSAGALGIASAALLARARHFDLLRSERETAEPQVGDTVREAMGQELFASLPLALILLDRNKMLRFANEAASDLFGPVTRGEALSSIIRSPLLAEEVSAVASGAGSRDAEFVHMQAREQRVLLAHICPIEGQEGRGDANIMILIEDHTRRARTEQMRRDFIANASHELKTPLAAITGFIETLQGPAIHDREARARFLPIMEREAKRMTRLVQDLMSLSRIEMSEHESPGGSINLGELLRETVAAVAPLAEAEGVRVEINLPKPGPEVIGDRDQLSQLFTNLIDNAIKYGGSGGLVRIAQASHEPGRGRMFGVSVTDRGPGIARRHIPRLTERFYRISDPRSRTKGGTGLGLSIVKHILNRHRGDLTIRSILGEGSSFIAWLPRAGESQPSEHRQDIPRSRGNISKNK